LELKYAIQVLWRIYAICKLLQMAICLPEKVCTQETRITA